MAKWHHCLVVCVFFTRWLAVKWFPCAFNINSRLIEKGEREMLVEPIFFFTASVLDNFVVDSSILFAIP